MNVLDLMLCVGVGDGDRGGAGARHIASALRAGVDQRHGQERRRAVATGVGPCKLCSADSPSK